VSPEPSAWLDSNPSLAKAKAPQRTDQLNPPQERFEVAGLPPPVSKAVTNQPDLPAGTSFPGFGKDSIPGNLHILKEPFRCPKNGGCEIQITIIKDSALVRNGLGIAEGWALEYVSSNLVQKFHRITNVQFSTSPQLLAIPCYVPFFFSSFQFHHFNFSVSCLSVGVSA